jgi:hypothetical protein
MGVRGGKNHRACGHGPFRVSFRASSRIPLAPQALAESLTAFAVRSLPGFRLVPGGLHFHPLETQFRASGAPRRSGLLT